MDIINRLLDQKSFKEAVEYYRQTLAIGRPNWRLFTFLGLSYIFLNQIDLAKNELRTTLTINPQNIIAQNALRQVEEL